MGWELTFVICGVNLVDRIAVVTDSSASLSDEEAQNSALRVIEIPVLVDGVPVQSAAEVQVALEQGAGVATAAPGVAVFERVYEALLADGFTCIFSLHMSGRLSSTYEHAQSAALAFAGQVEVYDTRTVGYAQGLMVLESLALVGRGASRFEVKNRLENYRPYEVIFLPRSVEALKQGGRVKQGLAVVAQLFQLVPWGRVSEGKLAYAGRAKTFELALGAIIEREVRQEGRPRSLVVQMERGKVLPEPVAGLGDPVLVREIPSVLLAHVGTGALAFVVEP